MATLGDIAILIDKKSKNKCTEPVDIKNKLMSGANAEESDIAENSFIVKHDRENNTNVEFTVIGMNEF